MANMNFLTIEELQETVHGFYKQRSPKNSDLPFLIGNVNFDKSDENQRFQSTLNIGHVSG
jgi:hypothetical protein